MTTTTILAFIFVAMATVMPTRTPSSWLDAKTLSNWNNAAARLPARPGPRDAELGAGGRCSGGVRPPSSPEDRVVIAHGWSLIGPYQRFGVLSVLVATSGADGMCRPTGYQGFVFVNGAFAGTLSPQLMDARTDGAMSAFSPAIYSSKSFAVEYARYRASDALCCPHATTSVTFDIKAVNGTSRAVPSEVNTQKNPSS